MVSPHVTRHLALPPLRALERRLAPRAHQLPVLLRNKFHPARAGAILVMGPRILRRLLRLLRMADLEKCRRGHAFRHRGRLARSNRRHPQSHRLPTRPLDLPASGRLDAPPRRHEQDVPGRRLDSLPLGAAARAVSPVVYHQLRQSALVFTFLVHAAAQRRPDRRVPRVVRRRRYADRTTGRHLFSRSLGGLHDLPRRTLSAQASPRTPHRVLPVHRRRGRAGRTVRRTRRPRYFQQLLRIAPQPRVAGRALARGLCPRPRGAQPTTLARARGAARRRRGLRRRSSGDHGHRLAAHDGTRAVFARRILLG